MKNYLTSIVIIVLVISLIAFSAFNPQQEQGKGNQKKEQQQNKGNKGQDKGNQGQGNKDQDKGNQGKNDDKPGLSKNTGNNKNDKVDNRDDRGQGNNENKNKDVVFNRNFKWDRETFKDRDKIKKQDKVTICHKFNRANEQPVTIRISSSAVDAHMNHGDVMGDCPDVVNDRNGFSEGFWKIRNRYYNSLYENQDQVYYSRSILDYALERLGFARQQLVVDRNSGLPVAVLERRQATVVELEQNVSLLETLLGVAATLVANKLAD